MLRLSRDIVSYARPSSSLSQPVVISSVIEQAFAFCEHLLEESGVNVDRKFGDGVLPVRGRPEQLAQVFVNLFTNACHAMPQKGGALLITTELSADETRVRVVVADNGHGIEPDESSARVLAVLHDEGRTARNGARSRDREAHRRVARRQRRRRERRRRNALHHPAARRARSVQHAFRPLRVAGDERAGRSHGIRRVSERAAQRHGRDDRRDRAPRTASRSTRVARARATS